MSLTHKHILETADKAAQTHERLDVYKYKNVALNEREYSYQILFSYYILDKFATECYPGNAEQSTTWTDALQGNCLVMRHLDRALELSKI